MNFIGTDSLSPSVKHWLANTRHPCILHVFDQACNLINEHRDVLSIVSWEIGNGPFNLVISNNPPFLKYINAESPVCNTPTELCIGSFTFQTEHANIWDPHPDWETMHAKQDAFLREVKRWSTPHFQASILQFSNSLARALAIADLPSSMMAAKRLAGSGIGLTPSGDDFIMGALYAAWIIHPPETAARIAKEIATTAAPMTTSLSAAWLNAAAKGEAGILWHKLFDALISGETSTIEFHMSNILSIGATSGADALAGFIDTFIAYQEIEKKHVIS